MELLDQLEKKIVLALETIELLNMENDELKQEVAQLQKDRALAAEQQKLFEEKVNGLLKAFDTAPESMPLAANS